MELGALVCTPRNPQCLMCPAKGICIAHKENRTAELPNLGERETATARRFLAFILEHDGEFLVRQRPEGIVNSHLWEFPNLEVTSQKPDEAALAKDFFGIPPAKFELLCTVKHSITRYRITVNAFTVGFNKLPAKLDGVWKSPARMRQLAFTAAHKKLASFAANRILSGR
jgi:A/G-specific adenine glycosylase